MFEVALWFACSLASAAQPRGLVHARVGALYDSDILIAPDSMFDQGTPSRFADYRLQTAGELGYALVDRERHRVTPTAVADLVNTAQAVHAAGDPYRFALTVPYAYQGPSYRLTVRPAYQSLVMDPTLTTHKSIVQESGIVDVETTWATGPKWATGLAVQYRRDASGLRDSVGPDDADATKLSAHVSESYLPGGGRSLSLDYGYVANLAAGERRRYQRAQMTVRAEGPLTATLAAWVEAGAYRLSMPDAVVKRRDLNLNAALGLRVALADGVAVEIGVTVAHNQGANRAFTYTRYTGVTALTLARGF